MNICEALIIVRNCALSSQQMKTKRGQAALKVIDKKIQGLLRSKGWRESYQAMPIHTGDESFLYPIPGADHVDMAIAPGVTALVAPNASPETVAALRRMAELVARPTPEPPPACFEPGCCPRDGEPCEHAGDGTLCCDWKGEP